MTIGEVKQFLYELVSMYHPKANIVWTKTNGVKPMPPYITLAVNHLERSAFPIVDEERESYYNYSMIFEINLYTTGKAIRNENIETGAYENTAVEDIEQFVRFLDSDEITNKTGERGVTILLKSSIRDLSELIGDTRFHYRAMAEFEVYFNRKSSGTYGIRGENVPNASGGGTKEYEQANLYTIETVKIEEATNSD